MSEQQAAPAMGVTEWVLLLILSVLWGGSFFFFKVLSAEFPPLTVVFGRVALAALALNLLLLGREDRMSRDPKLWVAFFIMGALNNIIPFTLIVYGETRISSGLASILNATTPIFTVLAAHALTSNEKLSWAKSWGVLFGFLGVAVLIGPSALSSLGAGDMMGELACLAAALVYAFAGIFGRRFRGIPPLQVATGQVTASTFVLIPLTAAVDAPWTLQPPSTNAWLAFSGIALFSTALAYIIYFRILAAAGATNLLLVTFLLPVSAMALGVAVLRETVTWQSLAGMTLISLGLVAIDGRAFRAVTPRSQVTPQSSAERDDYVI